MRRLATVQRIKTLEPISGKDKIVLASFEKIGFKVIVSKEESKIGDLVVYFEADTLLPARAEYEFLRARCWNEKFQGHRIRCMKMGGVFSEGLALPIQSLGILYAAEDEDFTDRLDVRKYDPEALEEANLMERQAKKHGKIYNFFYQFALFRKLVGLFYSIFRKKRNKSTWPQFLSKTDETRVQVLQYVFNPEWKDLVVYITEKLDGQSCTVFYHKGKFGVCSRNLQLKEDDSRYWSVVKKYNLQEKLPKLCKEMGTDLAIQMENIGPGIQGNKYKFTENEGYLFNVYDINSKEYMGMGDLIKISTLLDIPMVPVIETTPFRWNDVDELTKYADGCSVVTPGVLREGVVIRPVKPLPPERGMANMWSLKVISPSFMLKEQ